jgi:3',5'-cyclic AMP phosphodiesterase CpdA
VEPELSTVADDEAVVHVGADVRRYSGLQPGTTYDLGGVAATTLPRPLGERLATIATVNDVHFGELECGHVDGLDVGATFAVEPGEQPYPELMNRAAVAEMDAIHPDAVVVKGDLTAAGTVEEYADFLACWASAFGERMHHVRGNHDGYHGATFAAFPTAEVVLPGVRLAIVDTTRPGASQGQLSADQAEWLDELAARSDRPVLVFGHHHVWNPGSHTREPTYFGINPDDSDRLVDVVARRHRIIGYFAGHTHRNRVRRFAATGSVPWVEVSSVKDFPGAWAEYRVYEGGVLQVFRRISSPAALAWTERTRGMFGGLYPMYSFGTIEDRCFPIDLRDGP